MIIKLKETGSSDWHVMSGANEAGASVPSPSEVGAFHQVGHAFGEITLEARDDAASGEVQVTVLCEVAAIAPNTAILDDTDVIPTPAGADDDEDENDGDWPLWLQILMAPLALLWNFWLIIWRWFLDIPDKLKQAWDELKQSIFGN